MQILVIGDAGFINSHFAERFVGDWHNAEHTHADTTKANKLLGYESTHPIREGIETFVKWYRNREWYEPLVQAS
jgi:UDP-glucose 4-epimerase